MIGLTLALLLAAFNPASSIVTRRYEELQDLSRFSEFAIDLTKDGSKTFIYVRLCPWTLMDGNTTLISMTRYCYCKQSKYVDYDHETCSFPGPTLLMHSYTTVNVTLVNELVGCPRHFGPLTDYWNHYKDMDMTNLHVHGLHVSPFIDDIIFAKASPIDNPDYECTSGTLPLLNSTSWSYRYEFSYHYPGTFWYHAHHHGSTTWQVNQGLHGAILMNPWDDSRYPGDATNTIYEIGDYEEDVVTFQWLYAINTENCTKDDEHCAGERNETDGTTYYEALFGIGYVGNEYFMVDDTVDPSWTKPRDDFSMCDVYCQMPADQRKASQFRYDVHVNENATNCTATGNQTKPDLDCLFFFVNGQYQPTISSVNVNEYRRLRMVNSLSNWYLQMRFPSECEWYLIATDGIYTDGNNTNYPLNSTIFDNEYIMSPGGRVDFLYRCTQPGTFFINSSNNTDVDGGKFKSALSTMLPKVYDVSKLAERYLFSIEVVDTSNASNSSEIPYRLPNAAEYPPKPTKSYIAPFHSPEIERSCNQSTENCTFTLAIKNKINMINNKPFNLTVDGRANGSFVELYEEHKLGRFFGDPHDDGDGYQFLIENTAAHVYHQHVNPFNVKGEDGFISLNNTWWDTLGNNGSTITARMWTRGDWYFPDDTRYPRIASLANKTFGKGGGIIIAHCHLLQHEDKGMMGFYGIVSDELEYISVVVDEPTPSAVYVFLGVTVPVIICCLIAVIIHWFRAKRQTSGTKDEHRISSDIETAGQGSTEMTTTAGQD